MSTTHRPGDPAAPAARALAGARVHRPAVATPPTAAEPGGRSSFEATLIRSDGPGGWVFAPVPEEHAPPFAGAFGRVPVVATVDGVTWATSAWRDRSAGWLLAVPKRVRRGKDDGDVVVVDLVLDASRL